MAAKKKATKKKAVAKKKASRRVAVPAVKPPPELSLSEMEVRFCYEFIAEPNRTKAAIRAGYSPNTARQKGSEVSLRPEVQAFIAILQAEYQAQLNVNVQRVLTERARVAFFDPIDLFDENGALLPIRDMDADARRAIASVEVQELFEGTGQDRKHIGNLHKIKLWDKGAALTALERHLGMYNDTLDVNVTVRTVRGILEEIDGSSLTPIGAGPGNRATGSRGGSASRPPIEGEIVRP